jgi:carbon monoxide dehydrogenase subunit G
MRLDRRFAVTATPEAVWAFFWDIPALASCIPGCVGVEPVDEQRYTAVVEASVGRFRVQFELSIEVVESVDGESIKARAQGRDRITRSTMVSDLELQVAADGDGGTLVSLGNDLQVYGRLGSLGHSMIKRRSEDLMDQFADELRLRLAQDAQPARSASDEQSARVGAPTPER